MHPPTPTAAVILAGGKGRRLGGADKALLSVGGRPLIDHVISRLPPELTPIVISSGPGPIRPNRYAETALAGRLRQIPDRLVGWAGPAIGLLSAAAALARHQPQDGGTAGWLLSVPTDVPLIPLTLLQQLRAAATDARPAVARSRGQVHPTIALWPIASLCSGFDDDEWEGAPLMRLVDRLGATPVDIVPDAPDRSGLPARDTTDCLFNVNSPDDVARARLALAQRSAGGNAG